MICCSSYLHCPLLLRELILGELDEVPASLTPQEPSGSFPGSPYTDADQTLSFRPTAAGVWSLFCRTGICHAGKSSDFRTASRPDHEPSLHLLHSQASSATLSDVAALDLLAGVLFHHCLGGLLRTDSVLLLLT